jgi:hypothetical protein
VGASNVPSNKRARAGWRRLAMQMVLPEGVTLTGAGRHWPRAAPKQEVARWPPAASGSSRAGPTLENDSQSALIGRRGFFLSEILRESHNDSHKCGCKPDLVATILIRSDTCDTDQGSSGTILNPAKQPQSRQPAIPRENGGLAGQGVRRLDVAVTSDAYRMGSRRRIASWRRHCLSRFCNSSSTWGTTQRRRKSATQNCDREHGRGCCASSPAVAGATQPHSRWV